MKNKEKNENRLEPELLGLQKENNETEQHETNVR